MHPDMGDAVHSIVTETRHRVGSTAVLGERSGTGRRVTVGFVSHTPHRAEQQRLDHLDLGAPTLLD